MTQQLIKKSPEALCAGQVKGMLEKNKDAITASLPRGFDNPNRMIRAAVNAISTTPSLAKCTPESLFISIVKGFSLGLEPNGVLAHGYLVPFKENGVMKAQFMPGYRGLIELARRSGKIKEIYATEVFGNDLFEVSMGTGKELLHKPDMFSDRGELKGFYAVFKLDDGSVDFEIMNLDEIDKIKRSSKAGNSNFSPWNSGHFNEMSRKTVIKKLLKRAPMTVEAASAVKDDNSVAMGEPQDTSDVIDIVGGTVETSKFEEPVEKVDPKNAEFPPEETSDQGASGGDGLPGL
jgi:recombination protein RecT